MNAEDLVKLVRARHEAQQGWVCFEELSAGTGFSRKTKRYADVIALQTLPSRGIRAHGYEIKVDRGDLIKELRNPAKAEEFQRFCDHWWLVVPSADMLTGFVLPATWGVLVPARGKLGVHIKAPELAPIAWDKPFCAAIARAFLKGLVPKRELDDLSASIEAEVERRIQPMLEQRLRDAGDRASHLERDLASLKESVASFEKASGLKIAHWGNRDIGMAAHAVLRLQQQLGRYAFSRMVNDSRALAQNIERAHEAFLELLPEKEPVELDPLDEAHELDPD